MVIAFFVQYIVAIRTGSTLKSSYLDLIVF